MADRLSVASRTSGENGSASSYYGRIKRRGTAARAPSAASEVHLIPAAENASPAISTGSFHSPRKLPKQSPSISGSTSWSESPSAASTHGPEAFVASDNLACTADTVGSTATAKSKGVKRSLDRISYTESRKVPYMSNPSISVREQINKVLMNRNYLVSHNFFPIDGVPTMGEFFVLGRNNSVHKVTISSKPKCLCTDGGKGKTCKHLLFVLLRILKCSPSDPRNWKKTLTTSEVTDLLTCSIPQNITDANFSVKRHPNDLSLQRINLKNSVNGFQSCFLEHRSQGECPVCYENISGSSEAFSESAVFCQSCCNTVHKDCLLRLKNASGLEEDNCFFCHSPWIEIDQIEGSNFAAESGGYVNVAAYSENNPKIDTSLKPNCSISRNCAPTGSCNGQEKQFKQGDEENEAESAGKRKSGEENDEQSKI